jgi:hypothetical protein
MRRDWDVVRKILIKIETTVVPGRDIDSDSLESDGIDPAVAAYHMGLLLNANLINGGSTKTMDSTLWCFASGLTWEGHEFLDSIRQDTIWNKVKVIAAEKGLDLTFDTIKIAAKSAIGQLFG